MSEHFIKNIKINNFKCFKNFEANGFARVNLITGKNNVGKTAFMEACFLLSNAFNIFKKHDYNERTGAGIDREWFHFELVKLLLEVQSNREKNTFIFQWITEELKFNFDDFEITIDNKFQLRLSDEVITPNHFCVSNWGNWGSYNIANFRRHKEYTKLYTKNKLPTFESHNFNTICKDTNELIDIIADFKLKNQINLLNNFLLSMFSISEIDVIKDSVMLRKSDGMLHKLSTFGDGVRHFIFIVSSLMFSKNGVIYLDEMDNGIHYSKLDELWEVILKTSKDLNVQVFATTHSKECIESYARVAKKLADEEVSLTQLVKLKNGEIKSGTYDYEILESAILEQNHEVRG
jgi:AAA15 family ATPase/GTPase